jgi:hypothetical protein
VAGEVSVPHGTDAFAALTAPLLGIVVKLMFDEAALVDSSLEVSPHGVLVLDILSHGLALNPQRTEALTPPT